LILLLHGFPELAYSWSKILTPLANAHAGYRVVAPDLRGFGRTTTRVGPGSAGPVRYEDSFSSFHVLNIAEDVCSLVRALGYSSVAMLVGHDFGSVLAGHCVVTHPELFASVVFMSAPFVGVDGPPSPPASSEGAHNGAQEPAVASLVSSIDTALAALQPPRKHYVSYFSTPHANADMLGQGEEALLDFLAGYFYMKSGAWDGNDAHPLPYASSSPPSPSTGIRTLAEALATLPEYYVMPLHETMPRVVSRHVRADAVSGEEKTAMSVYAAEFARTGFQGGLNYYRSKIAPPPPERVAQLRALAGRRVEVPAAFIAGARDWGVYQTPGAEKTMREVVCSSGGGDRGMEKEDFILIEGAGHWVQQEAPDRLVQELVRFLSKVRGL